MKLLITILGILNGGFMLFDGIHVLIKGKYIGPEKPGPWAAIFEKLGVDVFKLGPLFIVYGILWLVWLYGLWTNQSWSHWFGIAVCILTLWYIPFGTLFSLIVLGIFRITWICRSGSKVPISDSLRILTTRILRYLKSFFGSLYL